MAAAKTSKLYEDAKKKIIKCPTCQRDLHNVRESLNHPKRAALVYLYSRAKGNWFQFPNAEKDPTYRKVLHMNHTKLPCWGLIESERVNPKTNKKKWRLTPLGLLFVQGKVGVPKYVYIPTGNKNRARGKPFGPKIDINGLEVK